MPTSAASPQRPLYGLVLAGGFSRRMGSDKGLLPVGTLPAREHMASLLQHCCQRVFLSLRPDQIETLQAPGLAPPASGTLPVIPDMFPGEGPLGAMLSAFYAQPNADWLILPCDLLLMTPDVLQNLADQWRSQVAPENQTSDSKINAIPKSLPPVLLLRHPQRPIPEPLCGIWSADAAPIVEARFNAGQRSVKGVLPLLTVLEYLLKDPSILHNNNYP